ncbi:MAG: argininosuccinate lyase [Deltaproteobacteria bacterium]|jgi:argininosuccinate lyase|nr:argininosuccinate lyase [Deltaproteobacteria bacterium]MBT4525665.1 argininosuccinate lyase [Deltaproteobacteria bacterium]
MSSKSPGKQVWGKRIDASPDQMNLEFCAGRDVKTIPMAENSLIQYDIWTNLAHVKMLNKVGVLDANECDQLVQGLNKINNLFEKDQFILDPLKEDVHINIEHYLTETLNISAAKKMHTGRSRNDQVATDMRLFLRDKVIELSNEIEILIREILNKSSQELESIMPGFTHYQPAMITTAAHWMTAWSQAILRDLVTLKNNLIFVNRSPLGSAASFGTSWSIDRKMASDLLGFDDVEENTLDCISSRGENEARIAFSISSLMNHLSTIAQDLILLSTPFYNMVDIDKRFVTGSSIMPQKQNPDFAEVLRGKTANCHGMLMSLLGLQKASMSGYNRDSQISKYTIIDIFNEILNAPLLVGNVIASLKYKKEIMRKNCAVGFINAADVADWLAQTSQLSFRECYDLLSLSVKYSEKEGILTFRAIEQARKELKLAIEVSESDVATLNSPENLIINKTHIGAPSPKCVQSMIDGQKQSLDEIISGFHQIKEQTTAARNRCFMQ